jgi:chemotaxis protein MotA
MDLGTAFGLLLGLGLISIGIVSNNGNPMWFLDGDALLIVLGGTFAATLVNYPLRDIQGLLNILSVAFKRHILNHAAIIDELVEKAEKSRKKGILSLEPDLPAVSDQFLRDGLELAINEKDTTRLRSYLELELSNVERRHSLGQEIFLYMGAYAPAFGMLGTVLGLIIMMTNFADSQTGAVVGFEFNLAEKFADLLGGMGLALITTFYGVLISNLIFLPLAGKLKRNSEEELMIKDIMIEGIIGIHAKDHPMSLKEKLMTFVPQSERVEAR